MQLIYIFFTEPKDVSRQCLQHCLIYTCTDIQIKTILSTNSLLEISSNYKYQQCQAKRFLITYANSKGFGESLSINTVSSVLCLHQHLHKPWIASTSEEKSHWFPTCRCILTYLQQLLLKTRQNRGLLMKNNFLFFHKVFTCIKYLYSNLKRCFILLAKSYQCCLLQFCYMWERFK